MKSFDPTPVLFIRKDGEVRLRGTDLIEIIGAVLARGTAFRFRVKGFSMWPFIKDEDIVTIAAAQTGRLRLGEVVAFVHPESQGLVMHRVIGKRGEDYLVQGDNALRQDGALSKARILGRVKKVERDGKGVVLGLGPERVLIALLIRSRFFLSRILFRLWVRLSPVIARKRVLSQADQENKSGPFYLSKGVSTINQSPPGRGNRGSSRR